MPGDPNLVVRILRKGQSVAVGSGYIERCDVVELIDPERTASVRLAHGSPVLLRREAPRFDAPCSKGFGFTQAIWEKVQAIRKAADGRSYRRELAAATRGGVPLEIPLLRAPQARLVAGSQQVYLRWQGGEGPFVVLLQRVDDGRVIAQVDGIAQREVHLPRVSLPAGRYRLEVRPARGDALAEEDLEVVPSSRLPALPLELAAVSLPAPVRAVLHADYLLTLDDGRWTLAAAQRVAAHAAKDAVARQWLDQHGGAMEASR